jgi:hypothetical protein
VFIQGILTPVPQELLHIDWIEIRGIRRPVVVGVVGSVMNDKTWRKRKLKTGGRWKRTGYILMFCSRRRRRQSRSASRGTTISASHKSCAFLYINSTKDCAVQPNLDTVKATGQGELSSNPP